MKDDRFVLVRKRREYRQGNGNRAKVYVTAETYDTLAEWCVLTGKTMVEIASLAVAYAAKHLTVVDEDKEEPQ